MTYDEWLDSLDQVPSGFEAVGRERMRQVWAAAQAAMWQPIETAPKASSTIVWDEASGLCISHFTVGVDNASDMPREGWYSPGRDTRDETMVLDGPVTHWMPIPTPPGEPS